MSLRKRQFLRSARPKNARPDVIGTALFGPSRALILTFLRDTMSFLTNTMQEDMLIGGVFLSVCIADRNTTANRGQEVVVIEFLTSFWHRQNSTPYVPWTPERLIFPFEPAQASLASVRKLI